MRLDDFESVFRSALKPSFERERVLLERVVHISDQGVPARDAEALEVRNFLSALDDGDHGAMLSLGRDDWASAQDLLDKVAELRPQLIVCQRHLGDPDADLAYTLGSVVDILTQATLVPVLLLPKPGSPLRASERAMVVTDHLTQDAHLVSWGVHMTPDHGVLFLAHIEDEGHFEHFAYALRRVPGVDTDPTLARLKEKLLSMPTDYVHAVQKTLQEESVQETVVPVVHFGNPVKLYPSLVAEHRIGLLICNTKDPGQQAMAGLAHALAVSMRTLPLLLV
ncbi:MAG: hypothetical protein ACI9VR_004576 [Cognaticolwellia sp.]